MTQSFEEIVPPSKNDGENEGDEKVKISTIFREDAPCRIIETMMEVSVDCAPKIFDKISEKLFAQKLVTLAQLPLANFSVQKLLNFCKSKEQVQNTKPLR
jgi:hypothetical protein